jgi:hypothetical protein
LGPPTEMIWAPHTENTAYKKLHTSNIPRKEAIPPGESHRIQKRFGHRPQKFSPLRSASLGGAFSFALGWAVRCRFGGCRSPSQERSGGRFALLPVSPTHLKPTDDDRTISPRLYP